MVGQDQNARRGFGAFAEREHERERADARAAVDAALPSVTSTSAVPASAADAVSVRVIDDAHVTATVTRARD